jgi:hypothetical protein
MASRVAAHDQQLIDQLMIDKQDILDTKVRKLKPQKRPLQPSRPRWKTKSRLLAPSFPQTVSMIQDIAALEAQFQEDLKKKSGGLCGDEGGD